jgi:hypothetical protein
MDENSYGTLSTTRFLWKYFKIHHLLLFFLRTFDKLIKAIVSFVRSLFLCVRPSVCMAQLSSHWSDFNEIYYLRIFFESLSRIFFKFH